MWEHKKGRRESQPNWNRGKKLIEIKLNEKKNREDTSEKVIKNRGKAKLKEQQNSQEGAEEREQD